MTTKRTTIPAAELLLGVDVRCLDHGFVRPVDYMGGDADIVAAARASHGPSGRPVMEDTALLRYLMRHWHTSPFEMAEVKFLCRMPLFVARQWIRHRTACLSGDTTLHFDLPGGVNRRGNQLYTLTMDEVWRRFQPTQNVARPDKQKNPHFRRDRVQGMLLRSIDEDSKTVRHTRIVDIWETGEKPVYEVTTESGHVATMSEDHRCFTVSGWQRLKDFVDLVAASEGRDQVGKSVEMLVVGPGRGAMDSSSNLVNAEAEEWRSAVGWKGLYEVSSQGRVRRVARGQGVRRLGQPKVLSARGSYAVVGLSRGAKTTAHFVHRLVLDAFTGEAPAGMQARHLDGNGRNNVVANLAWGTAQENADDRVRDKATTELDCTSSPIVSVKYMGVRRTYDIEVEGPWHNFSAGGLVVHNSVNEMSLRYSQPLDVYYVPEASTIAAQSSDNKQGRGLLLSPEDAEEVRAIFIDGQAKDAARHAALADRLGVARELARAVLPVSLYTQWVWKIDLHNLLHFLQLRLDPHAQYEIRVFAEAMAGFVRAWVPESWAAFEEYRLNAVTFGATERRALAMMIAQYEDAENVGEAAGLKGGELREFLAKVGEP